LQPGPHFFLCNVSECYNGDLRRVESALDEKVHASFNDARLSRPRGRHDDQLCVRWRRNGLRLALVEIGEEMIVCLEVHVRVCVSANARKKQLCEDSRGREAARLLSYKGGPPPES